MEQKNVQNAKKHVDIGQRYLYLKNEIHKISKKDAIFVKGINSCSGIKEKVREVNNIEDRVQNYAHTSYDNTDDKNIFLRNKNQIIQRKIWVKSIVIAIAVFIIIIGTGYFIWYPYNHKKSITKFKNKFYSLHGNPSIENTLLKKSEESKLNGDELMMSSETEQKILTKLKEFEELDLFINNNMSRAYLATFCETNGKYLSYVINKQKNKCINSYINELRINYIIRKLQNVHKYKKYKIAILSEEAGFSSPNRFSLVFKKFTGMSPSQFIKYLDEKGNEGTRFQ
ncbi:AraC family transcriptional regulator [Chryseobacterium nematophagum]|uniref:AraC family transcriptional regulator n=1 Tax=Chryseobacterium nematophagum TaxID=2305228 RepID=A0A3M7TFV1_9FLAO|nr:AraC family transcriptional regulator [Chryseobacterium nematophagum]RNA61509.1 AraC family transcriptional regulator [Chryseobacterium nematophagum]